MWFKKEGDLRLPKLPPRREKGALDLFRTSFKRVDIPKTQEEEPDILKKVDIGEKAKKVEAEFYFWLCDGRIIRNVEELTKAMKDMQEDVFKFHVSDYKNEFSDWVREVIKDEKLAYELGKAKTSEEAYTILSGKKPKKISIKRIFRLKTPTKMREEGLGSEELGVTKKSEFEKPKVSLPYKEKIIPKPERQEEMVRKAVKLEGVKEAGVEKKEKLKKVKVKGIDKISKMIQDADYLINQGDAVNAKSLMNKARSLLKRASIPKEEKKKLNYKIVEIETRAKLFMLS